MCHKGVLHCHLTFCQSRGKTGPERSGKTVRWMAAEWGLQGLGFGQEEGKGNVPSDPAEAGNRAGWCEVCAVG